MMRYVLLLFLLIFACKQNTSQEDVKLETETVANVQNANQDINLKDIDLKVYNFNELEPLLNKTEDKIYVVNFWATWCAPCVKELPYFEALNENYKNKNVEVLLVSLDFPKQYDTKLKPFIAKHKLKSEIVVLNDVDANTWIPKVDKEWTGAIPATIIYNKNKRVFFEKSFTLEELELEVDKFIN
ncbi:TlpA disulfide reductase family protein [Lacinutrix venerupis]|uniref:Thioredoxin n=1 Tax=Lacinutrix venerupis TaxID=1486034 RepID=A0AAC9LLF6_9FLAO|nr:TlpA disulfide reductase family protein [Lacinutrix venerupis]APY00981.1 thioredoxin [Lacinutrix venerupis]